MRLKPNQHLLDSLKKDKEILKLVSLKNLEKIFAGEALHVRVMKILKTKKVLSQKRSDS